MGDTKNKRVLVLSHNAFSKTQNNGKTLESFFVGWDKSCIAQLFMQPDVPDYDFCSNNFRITDYEVLNNVFFKGKIGNRIQEKVVDKDYIDHMTPQIKKLYQDRRNGNERRGLNKIIHNCFVARVPLFVCIREFLWKHSGWKSEELVAWIKEFKPDVLFFQGSSCIYGYDIALWICREFNIPLILELTDDYTACLYNWSILERITKRQYRRIFQKAITYAHKVIAISEYMKTEYKKNFGGDYLVFMNSVDRKEIETEPESQNSVRLLYAGNVSINRWKVLQKVGLALNIINEQHNMNCQLDIYTPAPMPEQIKDKLTSIHSIACKGSLNQAELSTEIQLSNILVHVEAFDKKMRRITRLSISTKIPEYMASMRCIFAVGPQDVASIMYLKDNHYAEVVVTEDINKIKEGLMRIITAQDVRKSYSEEAYRAFILHHHPETSQNLILEIVDDACREGVPQ